MKDLKRAFGSPDLEFQERVRQTLFRIEEKEETVVKKKLTFSMALALILCVCIITVSAFAGTSLLTDKPDVTQPPLSHSENNRPNGSTEPHSTDSRQILVLPTPTPRPILTPEPTPVPAEATLIPFRTPMPTASADPIYVWSAPGDASYHFNQFCAEAKKDGLARVSLAVAENRRQTQCLACNTLTYSYYELIREVYLPDNSKIFHTESDCAAMCFPAAVLPLINALNQGAQPCSLCADSSNTSPLVIPMPTPTPMPTTTPTPAALSASGMVYPSRSDDRLFHRAAICGETITAPSMALTDALNAGYLPCPACYGNDAFYTINGGDSYHLSDKTCFLFLASSSQFTDVSLAEALLRGKLPCKECVLNREESDDSLYYYTAEDQYCHSDPACLNEGDSAVLTASEEELIAMGKRACEACTEPFSYYFTDEGAYYHSAADCTHAGALMTEKLPEDQLIDQGKRSCPWCLSWYERYYSHDDRYYHESSDCESFIGAENAKKHASENTLLELGWLPCEKCFGAAAGEPSSMLQIFSTPDGSFYHIASDCSGMKNAEAVPLYTVLERNQTPCPVCLPRYIAENSTFYHMSESCSRLSGAQVQPVDALPDEYDPCALCVRFLDLNSNLYHRFARCSQFGGDVTANAYIPCSVELTALLESTPCELCAADVDSTPTATLAPAPDFAERTPLTGETCSDTTVFLWDSNAPVYHAVYNCSGYEHLYQMELTDAAAKNLTPCPECLNTEDTVWYAQDGEFYHSSLHYAYLSLPGVIECSPIDALADGRRPCSDCMLTETAKGDATLGSVPPLWSTGNGEIFFYDYTAGHSSCFHTSSSCEAHPMAAPIAISLETAVRFELPPCPECTDLLEQVITSESDGKLYHIGDECSSIASPEYLTRWNAKQRGLEPCPECAREDIDRGSPVPTVPPQPTMPPSADQQALRQWLTSEEEKQQCLTDLGYYSE